ncbi:MAG: xanthine dehydrogenase family protein molybdopterin-binding subunit, partial [Treponemataceae bacterium]|nr:xanthine dehydrogenase family protein molybdopterin-binding subunit [Treponemataceae bacterium]
MPEPKKPRRKKASAVRKSYRAKEYICDSSRSGMLYAALVRSPSGSGSITNITPPSLPEAYRLFTARDIPGENVLRTLGTDTEIFCTKRVHYAGEPVGIMVGPDPALVRKFAEETFIAFDSGAADGRSLLPVPAGRPETSGAGAVLDPPAAGGGAGGFNKAHSMAVLAERTVRSGIFKNCGAPEEAEASFTEAGLDISGSWVHDEAVPDWLERSGALCHQDGATLTVLTATQWPSHLQQALSTALGIDEEHIEIKKTLSRGGNTTGVWRCSALAVHTAVAAVRSGSPVKLTLSKSEQERFMKQGLKTWFSYRTAVDKNGVIQAMAIRIDADAGYANPFAQDIADRLTIAAASFYNPESLYVSTRVHSTAAPPSSFSPKMIDSQAFFAIENHIQQLADKTNLLPAELRSRNFGKVGAPFQFKVQRQAEVIADLMEHSDFLRKYSSYRINSIEKKHTFFALPRRGIGMSCAYDGAYFYGTHLHPCEHKMEVTLNTDGTLAIHAVAPSAVVGEIWTKLAAEILEFDQNAIVIDSEASSMEQTALPESLYSDISIMTMLLRRCCAEIKRKRFHAPLPITAKKTPTPAMKRQWNKESFSGTPFYSTSFGAAAVEVELDANSYRKKIRGIWVSIDCGEILSPAAAERTVRLAIQQELEKLVKDETGRCRNINISFIKSGDAP